MELKSTNVLVRYNKEQKKYHQKKADKAQMSLSEFLRQSADNAEIIVKDNMVLMRVIEELNRIGNNINQMAKAANSANLSGKVSDEMLREFCFRLQLYTSEVKSLFTLVKMKVD